MKLKNSIALFVIILLCSSCLSEEYNAPTLGKVNVTFSVTLPTPEEVYPDTRATYTDTDIKNIDLLVFGESNTFIERLQIDESQLTEMATGVRFTVQMDATPNNRTVHLIANGRSPDGLTDRVNFGSVTTGMLESAAIPDLQTSSLASGTGEDVLLSNVMPLVMWSRISLTGISIVTVADNVKLLRVAACIIVKKAAAGDGLSEFEIERIALNRAADQGKITPTTYTASPTATSTTPNPVLIGNYIAYNKTFSAASTAPSLYVYEKENTSSDYTSIIIQAKYKSRTGYYKVVMMNGNSPWNIIRNHRYNVTVISVSGYGYTDIATAVASAPSNDLKIAIEVDPDEEYPCLVADGQYVMGISCHQSHIYGQRGTQNLTNVELCKVYSSRGIEPNYFEAGSNWLTNITTSLIGYNTYSINADLNHLLLLSISGSTTLTVACDNLSHAIDISWTPGISTESDSDSYVVQLITDVDKNWSVQIIDSPEWVKLNATESSVSAYPGTTGMVEELTSKYSSQVYMHVLKGTSDRCAELKLTSQANDEPISRKIIVIQ